MENETKIPLFRRFVIQNFPYIEQDFDALTDYQLISKVVEYLNQVITSQNGLVDDMNDLETAFNTLKDYVDHYFDNLDVQEEINNKLDEMASDGTLEALISTEILGDLTQLHTTDKSSIVSALNEVNDNEVNLATTVTRLTGGKVLLIGDSYLQGYNGEQSVNSWGYYFKQSAGLDNTNSYILYESGAGFTKQGSGGHTLLTLLQANINSITNKNDYTDIIIGFGLNEPDATVSSLSTAIGNFMTYAKAQFPNAKIYLGVVGNIKAVTTQHTTNRERLYTRVLRCATQAVQYGATYLTGVEQVAHDYTLFGSDNIHLSQDGYQQLGWAIYQAWKEGSYNYYSTFSPTQTITSGGDLVEPTANITGQVRICGQNRQIVLNNATIGFTAFTVANAKIKMTADGDMANNVFFRNITISNPMLYLMAKFTKSDNSTLIYPCYLVCDNNNGSIVLNVPSELNGVEIKSIKLFIYNIYNIPTLLS